MNQRDKSSEEREKLEETEIQMARTVGDIVDEIAYATIEGHQWISPGAVLMRKDRGDQ